MRDRKIERGMEDREAGKEVILRVEKERRDRATAVRGEREINERDYFLLCI